ncbi:MAG: hypothetical protein JRN28_04780, partial [Nitrososphaerota archaeon]|nr:hypothetical protein [Nitrososphaerota archaeon]
MKQDDAYSLARAILLIGGIVAIAYGATTLGANIASYRTLADSFANTTPLLTVIVGVVALVTSNRVKEKNIDIVLAVLGF